MLIPEQLAAHKKCNHKTIITSIIDALNDKQNKRPNKARKPVFERMGKTLDGSRRVSQ